MFQSERQYSFSSFRNLLIVSAIILLLLVALSPQDVGAGQEPEVETVAGDPEIQLVHKVISPPGVFDPDNNDVRLWHDYGSFGLYLISDDALSSLAADMRSQVKVIDADMDRLLIDGLDETDLRTPKQDRNGDRSSESMEPQGAATIGAIRGSHQRRVAAGCG